MSGFAPPRRDCPSAHSLAPLPQSWDIATELKALHRHVTELTACVNDLQRQLDALQAPEPAAKKRPAPAEPKP
jgi:hypothetical protein